MTRRLQKHGKYMVLVMDKTMLEALHMTADCPVHITFSGGSMVVTPVQNGIPDEELDKTIARLRPRSKEMLKNLAEGEQ